MNHVGKNIVIAVALVAAGFLIAWLRYRPHLGTEGSFTDGERQYETLAQEPLRYALWEKAQALVDSDASRKFDPALSPDGRWMVFAVGERGLGTDLWLAPMEGDMPGEARALYEINSQADEVTPAFDSRGLYFASNREGGAGGFDLWRADFDNGILGSPERLPDSINSKADESDPAPRPMGGELVFASNREFEGTRDYDLYLAVLEDKANPNPARITKLSSPANDRDPAFTADGRTMFFASNRTGDPKDYDLFRTVLDRTSWLAAEPVHGLQSVGSERGPQPSPDGFRLLFSVESTGGHSESNPSQLFSAKTRELFMRPGAKIGLTEILLLLALLLLALLAWLAKRWTTVEVIYRCFLVSLIVHAMLMWWFRDVVPEKEEMALAGPSATYQVRLARNSADTARQTMRSGELQGERQAQSQDAPSRGEVESKAQDATPSPTSTEAQLSNAPAAEPNRTATIREQALAASNLPKAPATPMPAATPMYDGQAPELRVEARQQSAPSASERSPSQDISRPLVAASANPSSDSSAKRFVSSPTGQSSTAKSDLFAAAETPTPQASNASASLEPARSSQTLNSASGAPAIEQPQEEFAPYAGTSPTLATPSPTTLSKSEANPGAPLERTKPLSEGGPSPKAFAKPSRNSSSLDSPALPTTRPLAAATIPEAQPTKAPRPSGLSLATPTDLEALDPGSEALENESSPTGFAQEAKSFERKQDSVRGNPNRFAPKAKSDRAMPIQAPLAKLDLPPLEAPTPVTLPASPVTFEHTPYQNRFGLAKEKALAELGGSAETEKAVASGLRYLAQLQHQNGYWGETKENFEKYRQLRIGKTGLCTLAFLGAGHTHQSGTEYSANVERAIQYLLDRQNSENGHFGNCAAYGHGVATYALAECYALTKDQRLQVPLQNAVARILSEQNKRQSDPRFFGGWNYYYPDGSEYDEWPRVSVTSWQVMALESARLGGLLVPESALDNARTFLLNAWDPGLQAFRYNHAPSRLRSDYPTLPASTPAAMFALSLLDVDIKTEEFAPSRQFLLQRTPSEYRLRSERAFVERASGNLYFWYYSSLALLRVGGNEWKRWNSGLKETLLPSQEEDGSWEPISIYANYAGDSDSDRSYTTAMCVLSLEVYYRYFTPLLQKRD